MTASPNRRPVIVGLFVAVALAILAGGVLAIGNIRDTFTRKIEVSAVFSEVNGLQAGDNVWCSGLKVGVVKDLAFIDTAKVEVRMLLDAEVSKHIHKDGLARLGSDGLIGNPIVILGGGSPDQPTLTEGDVLAVETVTSTREVMAMLQENNKNLLAITTDIREVTGRLNAGEGTVGRLLKDEGLATQVSTAVGALEKASIHAEDLTASLATFSGKLNREGGLANELATDEEVFASIKASVKSLEASLAQVGAVVDGLAADVEDPSKPLGAVLQDEAVAADLKTVIGNLEKGSVLLVEDLKAIQSNFLFRPYFKKQEREAAKAAREAARGR